MRDSKQMKKLMPSFVTNDADILRCRLTQYAYVIPRSFLLSAADLSLILGCLRTIFFFYLRTQFSHLRFKRLILLQRSLDPFVCFHVVKNQPFRVKMIKPNGIASRVVTNFK